MTVTEQRLGEIPWLVVRGERLAAFTALGEHAREHIVAAVTDMPDLAEQRRRLANPTVAGRYATAAEASKRRYPQEWAELEALARGAGVAFDDLLLLNLRGDLGVDDTGCTDLCYAGDGVGFIAHNEDGAAEQDGRCRLLTLAIDGDVPMTTWWSPGFVPSSMFTVTGNGLAWGIDHLGVREPAAAPGRHFVARAAQHETTVEGLVAYLAANPSAGGFAYTIGHIGHPEATVVETAAGKSYATSMSPERPFDWHTNHLRHLPVELEAWYQNSVDRGTFLSGLEIPARPDAAWFLSVLATKPVLRDEQGSPHVTLATFVIDLIRAEATIRPRGGEPVSLPVADLVAGVAA